MTARTYRIAAISALTLLVALAACLGVAYTAMRQVRPFYREALALDPIALKEGGRELESRASALFSDSRKPGEWRAVFTAEQINGWMATQMIEGGTKVLPKNVDAPRVGIGEDKFTLGFRAKHVGIETVVSADASAMVTESGDIAIRLESVHAGELPLPALQVADEIAKACQALRLPIRWTQQDGEPVALISICQDASSSRGQMTIDAIELRDGTVYVAGHTDGKPDARAARRRMGTIVD